MDQCAPLGRRDLLDPAESLVHIRDELDVRAVAPALLDAERVGVGLHHDLGAGADRPRREGGRDRVIASADGADAARALALGQHQHVQERAARLEAARVLEQLQFHDRPRAEAEGGLDRGTGERLNRRAADPLAEQLARGQDVGPRDPRCLGGGLHGRAWYRIGPPEPPFALHNHGLGRRAFHAPRASAY
jgi:hypothetical protein